MPRQLSAHLLICVVSLLALSCGCDTKPVKNAQQDLVDSYLKNNEDGIAFDAQPEGFTKAPADNLFSRPLTAPAESGSQTRFVNVSDSGIKFKNTMSRHEPNLFAETGSGVAIADYDNDGLPDVYLTGSDIDNRLFKNLGGFKFEDVTDKAGVDGRLAGANVLSSGASFADIDNDGDLDLYVCNMNAPNILYVNQNDGTFIEQTKPRGADYQGASKIANFCDYDRDGDLDFYLTTYQDIVPRDTQFYEKFNGVKRVRKGYEEYASIIDGNRARAGEQDWLFKNKGDGTFEKLGAECGIEGFDANLGSVWFDADNDGWQDLYVSSDFKQADHLYHNNRDGSFTDVIADTVRHTPWFSMGLDAADLNNDGLIDLMVGDMADPDHYGQKVNMGDMETSGWFLVYGAPRQFMQNCLFVNAGDGRMMEHGAISGLSKTDWTWAIRMVDLNNDGKLDVYVTNGHARDNMNGDLWVQLQKMKKQKLDEAELVEFARKMPTRKDTNMVFQNMGDLKFEPKGTDWGLDHTGISHGAAFADLDGDGDLDAIVNNYYEPASIYRNESDEGARILVQLRCKDGNHFGIGSKVEIWQNGNYQRRDLMSSRGYLGSDPMELHFGLAESSNIERLKVTWPDGTSQDFSDLATNHVYRVIESSKRTPEATLESAKPLFANATKSLGVNFRHTENEFNDFEREPLLPFKLSQLGGSVAVADVNDDGFQDVFCGGASGQAGQFLINDGGTSFRAVDGPWSDHAASEDMGVLFFDADADGDQDLTLPAEATNLMLGPQNIKIGSI